MTAVPSLVLAAVIGLTGLLRAQIAPAAVKALDAFEAVQAQPEAERAAAARALGRFGDQDVTEALSTAFAKAKDESYRSALIDALGQVVRAGAIRVLVDVLEASDSTTVLRASAARGLARQGEKGIDELVRVAMRSGTDIATSSARTYAMSGLSTANDERGWSALASISVDGELAERRTAIRYLERAPDLPQVRVALVTCADDKDTMLAANAVRMVAERRLPDARAKVAAVVERVEPAMLPAVRLDLIQALAAVLEPSLFDRFLGLAALPGGFGQATVDKAIDKVASDAEFVAWLRKEASRRKDRAERCLAIKLLGKQAGDDITALLLGFARSVEPEVVTASLRALGERKDTAAVPELRKLLRAKGDERRLEVLSCLHALLSADKEWHAELVGMLRTVERGKDIAQRALLLDLLADVGSVESLPSAWQAFEHKNWTVRAAAYDFCRVVRDIRSIPRLIARLDQESGRLREDVLDVLMSLTSMRFNDVRHWNDWWKEHAGGFQLIPAGAARKHRPSSNEGSTVSYYGIPLISDRVVFVVDVSGSMSAKVGTGGTRTRLDEAKSQLHRVVDGIPKHFRFNIVPFHTTVSAVLDKLMPAADATRAQALTAIDDLKPLGGTNVHAALLRAFEETDVDTIYLLSDGSPSAGEITDPNVLADEVARWNKTRRIRIHCISIGTESPMLKRLAVESGGEYGVYN